MAYTHKIRVSHILDDLDRGYIKSKEEYQEALNKLDKATLIEHFLNEFEELKEEDQTKDDKSPINLGEQIDEDY